MIKLTVHESVEAALRKAFPTPAAAAKRALAKYISVVESMLFDALQRGQTPEQRKLGLYAISLDQLANKGGQIGPKKIRVHKWLTDNDWDIVQTVVKGTKFSGQNSQVKLTALVTVQNNLQVPAASLSAATTDEEIDAYLSGDDVSNIALFDHLYPEYNLEWREAKLRELFDWVPVDAASVKAYVYWLETESKLIRGPKKDLALRQALTILGIAAVTKGYYLQRKKLSPFGRTYYEGVSVQNVNKELRRAMLGNCWEYDIRSSVVAWKMGYARGYLAASGLDQDLKKSFPATLLYLEDKADFMATVRYFVFPESSPVPKELRPKLLKQAFTAISFGARQTAKGWLDASGNWTNLLQHAARHSFIQHIPEFPKVGIEDKPRGWFNVGEYKTITRAAKKLAGKRVEWRAHSEEINGSYFCEPGGQLAPADRLIKRIEMTRDLSDLIVFMVNSYIRPTDIRNMQHKHVEIVRREWTYLRLSLPPSKGHTFPITTMPWAVKVYERIRRRQAIELGRDIHPEDYVFMPSASSRDSAMKLLARQFEIVLEVTGLKLSTAGETRTLYSLRHSSIMFRLLFGRTVDTLTLARNARTSPEMIDRFYAAPLQGEMNVGELQSKRRPRLWE